MAKKYLRRYRRRSRWSANIDNINGNFQFQLNPNGSQTYQQFTYIDLQTNPAQNSNTVSQQYTVKNVEMSYEVEASGPGNSNGNSIENLQAYIIYVPQGMAVNTSLPFNHPEYILAYRWLGSPNYDNYIGAGTKENVQPGRNPLFIKSRMARKLHTGDRIVFLLIGLNENTDNNVYVYIRGLVRYWTKAN